MLLRKRRTVRMSALFVIGFLATFQGASAACIGDTPKTHSIQTYDFVTNSYFKRCSAYVCFYTCFESKMTGAGQDVWLHWYTPGHTAWLPPGEDATYHRFANNDRHILAENTCVEYGNNAKTVRAPLIARDIERDVVAYEAVHECVRPSFIKRASDKAKVPPPSAVNVPIRRFFPSNGNRPSETMLVLTGYVGLKPVDTYFLTFFEYAIERYPGRKEGEPNDLRLRPRLEHETEFLLPYFLKAYREGVIPLAYKGSVSFAAPLKSSNIASAVFDIVDPGGTIVGTMALPVFVFPREPR